MGEPGELDRPITPAELEVIRAALERVPVSPHSETLPAITQNLEHLRVVDRCECGCASVDFAKRDPSNLPHPIADGIGTTASGGKVGVIIWGTGDAVTGLEIYDLGAGDGNLRLPTTNSIRML